MMATLSHAAHFPRRTSARLVDQRDKHTAITTVELLAKNNKVHAIPKLQSEQPFRIQKHKHKHIEASLRSQTTAEKFSDRLDEYRETLYKDADNDLRESEAHHVETINTLAKQFEQHLALFGTSEQQLAASVADEGVKESSSGGCSDLHGRPKAKGVTLGERMTDFCELVEAKEIALQQLFDDWNCVQTEIIAAAVECLGPESVEVEEDQLYEDLTKAMSAAAKEHEKMGSHATTHLAEIGSLEAATKALKEDTERVVNRAASDLEQDLEELRKQAETAQQASLAAYDGFFGTKIEET